MKVSRVGGAVNVQFTDNAVFCGKCGHLFREFHVFSDRPFEKCPRCSAPGPFRKATQSDVDAYAQALAESRRLKPLDYVKALGGLVIVGLIVAVIAKWVVDAYKSLERTVNHRGRPVRAVARCARAGAEVRRNAAVQRNR